MFRVRDINHNTFFWIIKIHIPIGARDVDSKTTAPLDKSKTVMGICFVEDEYVDDANYPSTIHLPLYLPIINIEDIDARPIDFPKNFPLGFISNPFILFWSIYHSSYSNNKQMELFTTNIQWHTSDELPEDSDKNAILIYNVKEDDYDISFYNKCPEGYLWCYFKDILPPIIKREYLENNEKDFQEFLKTKL